MKTLLVVIFLLIATSANAINIPLTVTEVLPSGISGLSRTDEIVTSGVPLADSDGITSISSLGLSGTTSGQFRIIASYPSGNAKWVLVDFPATVTAGGSTSVSLVDGSGNFGGSNLATDSSTISIDTGAATFTVKKTGFNILDTAVVGSTSVISTGNAGAIVAIGTDATEYSSANDTPTVTVEENGPVRAVVKSMGTLKSSGAVRLIDYTLRLYFFKGKSQVKSQLVLRNAATGSRGDVKFKSISMNLPTAITGTKTASFATGTGTVSDEMGSGETAYLYQGWNSHIATALTTVDCYYWLPNIPGTCSSGTFTKDTGYVGLDIKSGATVLNTVGTATHYSKGYADYSNASNLGVSVAELFQEIEWGSGVSFTEVGVVSVDPWSTHNGDIDVTMFFAKYKTLQYMFGFHTAANTGEKELYALQYPLIARASLSHYAATGAFLGQTNLATTTQEADLFTDYGETAPTYSNPAFTPVYKEWQWNKPGGDNQINFPLNDLLDFVRTGYGGYYLKGWQRTDFNLDTACYKSDGFAGYATNATPSPSYVTNTNAQRGPADAEHMHFSSSPIWYFMTGDENTKDRYLEVGEWVQANNDAGFYAVPATQFFRAWSHQIKNLSLAYEFTCQTGTCNSTIYDTIETAVDTILDSRENPASVSTYGRSMDRGYTYWETITNVKDCANSNTTVKRALHSLYIAPVHFEGMYHTWRVLKDTAYGRKLDLRDYMTGLAKFLIEDYVTVTDGSSYFYGSPTDFTRAFEYNLRLDEAIPTCEAPYIQPMYRTYNIGRAADWSYVYGSGGDNAITTGERLLWASSQEGTAREPSDLSGQAILSLRDNKASVYKWSPLSVSVVDNGGGSYTLSWTNPSNAAEVQIKHSSKPIIEWLGFDKVAREYAFAPANYTPFFAATNIASNPTPTGSSQSVTLTGLATDLNFSAKYLDGPPLYTPAGIKASGTISSFGASGTSITIRQ